VRGPIHQFGCPSIDLAARVTPDPSYANTIIVLQHPVTNEAHNARHQIEETYKAVSQFPNYSVVWFWPGQDAGTEDTAKFLRERQHDPVQRAIWRRHLPATLFLSAVRGCACVVGNSSLGIRECAFLGIPAVDVGTRQQIRECGPNRLWVGHQETLIANAICSQIVHGPYQSSHLYGDGTAGPKIAQALIDYRRDHA
jgi:UDP-N-acetylglucosamine 2-epimerase